MTPNDIEILIHCHTTPSAHPRIDTPAVKDSLKTMEDQGLISKEDSEGFYRTTDKGAVYMTLLCSVPMPKQAWVDHDNNVISF